MPGILTLPFALLRPFQRTSQLPQPSVQRQQNPTWYILMGQDHVQSRRCSSYNPRARQLQYPQPELQPEIAELDILGKYMVAPKRPRSRDLHLAYVVVVCHSVPPQHRRTC